MSIGNEQKSFIVDYPEFSKKAALIEQVFFENFKGAMNSILLYSELLTSSTLSKLYASLPNGISNEQHIKILSGVCPRSKYNGWSCTRVKQGVLENFCDGYTNLQIKKDYALSNMSKYIDSVLNLVPLLHIAAVMKVSSAQKIFNELLDLFRVYFTSLVRDFNKETKAFVRALGLQLLSMDPMICNEGFIEHLGSLMTVNALLRKRMIKMIMSTMNFWVNIEYSLLPLFWETLKASLSCDLKRYLPIVNASLLLHFMSTMDKRSSCCNKHSLTEDLRKGVLGNVYMTMKSVLKFLVTSDSSKTVDNMFALIDYIALKPSPCFFIFLISVLKELADSNPTCAKALCKIENIKEIFKIAQDYPTDVKISCFSFFCLVSNKFSEWNVFKVAILNMFEPSFKILHELKPKSRSSSLVPQLDDIRKSKEFSEIKLKTRCNSISEIKVNVTIITNEENDQTKKEVQDDSKGIIEGEVIKETVENKEEIQEEIQEEKKIEEENKEEAKEEKKEIEVEEKEAKEKEAEEKEAKEKEKKEEKINEEEIQADNKETLEKTGKEEDKEEPEKNEMQEDNKEVVVKDDEIQQSNEEEKIKKDRIQENNKEEAVKKSGEEEDKMRESKKDKVEVCEENKVQSGELKESVNEVKRIIPYIYIEMIKTDMKLIYQSILHWLLGKKPEQALKQDSIQPSDIKQTKALLLLLSFITEKNAKKCLNDLYAIGNYSSANKRQMLYCDELLNWLCLLETEWYAKGNKELALAFEFHANVLSEGLKSKEGIKRLLEIFASWSVSIQPKENQGDNFTAESIQANFNETDSWICFKSVLMKILESGVGENDKLRQLLFLIEITLKSIVAQNLTKGFGVKVTLNIPGKNNNSDQRLIETALESVFSYINTNENIITEHINLLNTEIGVNMTLIVYLINIGLRGSSFDGIPKWLARLDQYNKYIVRLTNHEDPGNVTLAEYDNLLLCFAILLREHSLARKSKLKARITNARNAITSTLLLLTDEENKVKEFIMQTLELNSTTLDKIKTLANENSEDDSLDKEYGKLNECSDVVAMLERISEESLEMFKLDFNTLANSCAVKEDIVEVSERVSKKVEMKEFDILTNLNITKWKRKWIKLEKYLKQGFWRNRSLFDDLSKVPLKFSKHIFKNGSRCIMKIRYKKTDYIPDKECPSPFNTELSITCPIQNNTLLYTATPLNETFNNITQTLEHLNKAMDCEIYTCFCARKGQVMLHYSESKGEYYMKFIYSTEKKDKADVRLMLSFVYKPTMKLIKRWRVSLIRTIYRKSIVERKSGLEVVNALGKSVLLNFPTETQRDLFCQYLSDLATSAIVVDCVPLVGEETITKDWVNWKVSTFDYLMTLNGMASRSIDNISQYPVLPWIFNDIFHSSLDLSSESSYRDLTISLGVMGEESKERVEKRYEQFKNMNESEKSHYGSHYSHQGIVYQYLMRTFPFIEGYIRLFSGMDVPNRMFHSIKESLIDVKCDPSNIKEFIPEYFTVPEMFLNKEGIKFGKREGKEMIGDVVLPPWANGSAYKFIEGLREMLESDFASERISRWIDLIFGYQQLGKEAIKAFNTFPRIAYEAEKIIADSSGYKREAFMIKAYHRGQTPLQLFNKKHPKRTIRDNSTNFSILDKKIKTSEYNIGAPKWKPSTLAKSITYRKTLKVFTNNSTFTLVTLNGIILEYTINFIEQKGKEQGKSYYPSITNAALRDYNNNYFHNGISFIDSRVEGNFPLVLVKRHNPSHFAQGGYRDGTIQFTQLDNLDKIISFKAHRETVTCLELDEEEEIAVSGSISGEVTVYEIMERMEWKVRKRLWDHGDKVTSINLSNGMRLFCTAGADGLINLYTYSGNILRTIRTYSLDYVRVLCYI